MPGRGVQVHIASSVRVEFDLTETNRIELALFARIVPWVPIWQVYIGYSFQLYDASFIVW
jgi:hypothetical protein